ncbi:MAG: methyltransferase domain-containing protein [Actinobacteria bacterium]|nr:methyltransferase domain-containing protein [Actinomycetota bacterium]
MNRPQHPGSPYFADVGDRLGANYLRYSFTKGTDQEVAFLLELLDLSEGARVLDVGCGPGRHVIPLAQAGLNVTGVDVSERLLGIARDAANEADLGGRVALFDCDARTMPFEDEFDAVISICQGGFGLMGRDDGLVLRRMMEATKRGGVVVVTAFSAYFEAAAARPEAHIDVDNGIVHERARIKEANGAETETDLWTSVYTPRELRLLALGVGLVPEHVWSVEPGGFARRPPDLEHPEFMLVARKPRPA